MQASVRHYRIVRPLGAGGMGEVYLAQDTRLERPVALKFLPAASASDPRLRQRFLAEARAIAALNHPNICTIHDVGEAEDGRPYIAMELLEGEPLSDRLKQERFDWLHVVDLGLQVAGALAVAHEKGIVHRDIKPSNLQVTHDGRIKVLDFGLAKRLTVEAAPEDAMTQAQTQSGQLLGTPHYMSPEQALGREVDARTDLFALGAVLYEMVAGRAPFAGVDTSATLTKILHGTPDPLARFDPAVPEELERIILKCLRKSPEDRYPSARDLIVDLRHLREQLNSSPDTGSEIPATHWAKTGQLVTLVFLRSNVDELERSHGVRDAGLQLEALRQRLTQQLKGPDQGAVLETTGSTTLVAFARPSAAVAFALAMQQPESGPLTVRIGIHLGEVMNVSGTSPHDRFGDTLVLCERLLQLAGPGQSLLSRAVFDSARPVLKGDEIRELGPLEWLNYGPYLLRDIAEPVEICEVRRSGGKAPGPPPSSETAQRQVRPEEEPILGWRPAIGQVVPHTRWELERSLGEGGFGEVWLGRHQTMKERRVFKFCFQADRVRSLKREMTLFRLIKDRIGDHPNIVSLREVCFDQPPFYVEMDYVDGLDLRAWAEAHGGAAGIPLASKLEIIAQVADALQAAHDAGVIHRDVKPGNILIAGAKSSGLRSVGTSPTGAGSPTETTPSVVAQLTDFGIGQVVSSEHLSDMTRAGFTLTVLGSESSSQTGTQLYMAPELLAGKPATPRSDLYSLGVVLYQFLVGDFTRPLTVDWARHIEDPLLRHDLNRCLTGDPSERFGSAAELARNLRQIPERHAEQQRRDAEQRALERAAYRRGMMRTAGVAAVILALIAGLGLIAARQSRKATQTASALDQHLYGSEMAVAWNAWEEGDVDRTRRLLTNRLEALREGADLRGFEWRYLWSRSRPQEQFVLNAPGTSVKFSPNGRLLATFGGNTVQLWDSISHQLVRSIPAYTNSAWSVAFSRDGTRLATCSRYDSHFKIWDAASGSLWATLPATNQENLAVCFSPDGKRLATVAATVYQDIPPDVHIWDLTANPPRIQATLRDLKSWAWCIDFSPDGGTVAFPSGDGLIRLWDLKTGGVRMLTGHTGFATGVRFSPDGKILATGDQTGTILVWDWRKGTVLKVLNGHLGPINGLAITSDSRRIASSSRDHTARLWDLNSGELLARYLGHTDRVWALDLSPDGKTIATIGGDATRFWEATPNVDGDVLADCHQQSAGVGYSPDSRFAYLDEWDIQRITFFDARSRKKFVSMAGRDFQYSPDGKLAAFIRGEGQLVIADATSLKTLSTIECQGHLDGTIAFSPDGRILAIRRKDVPFILDLASQREITTLPAGTGRELLFTPDGHRLVTEEEGGIRIWNARTWESICWLCPPTKRGGWLRMPRDGSLLASVRGTEVRLWDLNNLTPAERPFLGRTASDIYSLAFSPDGKNVAAGTFDGVIVIWNVAGRQEVGSFKLHRSYIKNLNFSPDGRSLISQSYDHTVRQWTVP